MNKKFIFKTNRGTAVEYEAYFPGHKYTDNGTRLAIRIVVNNEPYLYTWSKGYNEPGSSPTNKRSLDMDLVKHAFVSMNMVSPNVLNKSINTERVQQTPQFNSANDSKIKELEMQIQMMQKQMELMSVNNVQMAQMIQNTITMNSMQMNMNSLKSESASYEEDTQDNFIDNKIEFNFDAVEQSEEEFYIDDVETIATAETKVEEIEESPKPRRRAASRE